MLLMSSYDTIHRFYPSEARTLAEKIITKELTGKEFDEDEAKEWSLNIADRIKAGVRGKLFCDSVAAFINVMPAAYIF